MCRTALSPQHCLTKRQSLLLSICCDHNMQCCTATSCKKTTRLAGKEAGLARDLTESGGHAAGGAVAGPAGCVWQGHCLAAGQNCGITSYTASSIFCCALIELCGLSDGFCKSADATLFAFAWLITVGKRVSRTARLQTKIPPN